MQEVQPLIFQTLFQCQNKNPATNLCSYQGCLNPALICEDKSCDCYTIRHSACKKGKVKLKDFIQENINNKRAKLNQEQENFYQKLIGICDDLIEKLSEDKLALMQAMQMPGIGYNGRQFINLLNDNRSYMIKGDLVNEVTQEISPKVNLRAFKQHFEIKWSQKSYQFEQLRQYLRMNEKLNFKPKLASVITDAVGQSKIRQFLQRKVKDFQLIYRFVKRFGKKDFHNCCDDISDTLVIVKTNFGKIIGGYTPIPWKSPATKKYVIDSSRKTFLFSLSLNQKFPLIQSQGYAVIHDSDYGPIFGGKNDHSDMKISDKSRSCSSYFPTIFNDPNREIKRQGDFTGQKIGNGFEFVEYQVFKVIWK